jgi:ABC-type lipoprotein export system ATPase subunit
MDAAITAVPTKPVGTGPILELRGVGKSFTSGNRTTEVLAGIDLTIGAGEFVAIVGFSGSGKTTLISLLAGLERPTAGSVLFEGYRAEPRARRGLSELLADAVVVGGRERGVGRERSAR